MHNFLWLEPRTITCVGSVTYFKLLRVRPFPPFTPNANKHLILFPLAFPLSMDPTGTLYVGCICCLISFSHVHFPGPQCSDDRKNISVRNLPYNIRSLTVSVLRCGGETGAWMTLLSV